ncbi:bacillithiol system redox-active protein YtxJ [Aneurinibacillus sp. Ricciae_BoGa-3]|uniref:bacillithiol system redox-active protein YtxJ n=1 Tax=Aneurinibacillus sp. Ricciae_BoGa-3 TaxID=3022697 RepID=UPI0023413BF4|nr:bacillithiol system redox-active protein YtxJ [Aneurinibacillus sp. Ricciae_BoGa-3]WCK52945.1 bacillithiol system redox-active protein YtxJ [Aneurinibacillus sp. Ricciae_BoGa-3]
MSKITEIRSIEDWKTVLQGSEHRPALVFKHSTACPISANAWQEYQNYAKDAHDQVDFVFVKVIETRPVSNKIADDLAIKHASPQIILVQNKKGTWNTSHWNITRKNISEVLNEVSV